MSFSRAVISVSCLQCIFVSATNAQTIRVPELLKQRSTWSKLASSEKRLHVSGRYEGRLSKQFQMMKLPVVMRPARTTVLPEEIEAGQRLAVSGVLRQSGARFYMDVDRIVVGGTDSERIRGRLKRLGNKKPEEVYSLATEFESIATFYDDDELQAEIRKARSDAFEAQRKEVANDPAGLRQLAIRAADLGVTPATIAAMRFQALVVQSKVPKANPEQIIKRIRNELPGWDKPNPFLDANEESAFLKDPINAYQQANSSVRPRMHRRFYRLNRQPQIVKLLKTDGSNGLVVANQLQTELPEATTEITQMKERYVEFRLAGVPDLTRKQLEDLDTLLREFKRASETEKAVDNWLRAQEQRLNNGELDGILATADQYLFAYERWKKRQYHETGTTLLKRAWLLARNAAPKEAAAISRRLEQYGWTWLHDKWMTTNQVENLPKNDVALALRESRVVPGMTAEQVGRIMNLPSRNIRVISAGAIHEMWIFGEAGSTGIVVHLKRSRFEDPKEAIVTLVAKESI